MAWRLHSGLCHDAGLLLADAISGLLLMPPKMYVGKAPNGDLASRGRNQTHHTFTACYRRIDSLHTTRIAHVKRIYLLRHGKSDWDADDSTDHDRPLKNRGVRAARGA